jgi:putative ABC transport system ATP-binding protein
VTETIVSLRGVEKRYDTPAGAFVALRDVDLEIAAGELLAVVGRSGSGKTTLIHLLTGIDRASRGRVVVAGEDLSGAAESALARWRGRSVGIVFQFFQLLPTLTIAENVIFPMELARRYPARERRARALRLLESVGIRDQADKLPAALSGGQQQRAAIARALANDPPLVVADEPTGNLDAQTSDDVWALFTKLREAGKTVVVVSHDRDVARWATRRIELEDGRVVDDARAPARLEVAHG